MPNDREQLTDVIATNPMSGFQIMCVAMCVFLNALDGFDILAIAFAAPGIAAEWSITRGMLGIVLSFELLGLGLGSVFVGRVADKIGRRPVILRCLVLMVAGMIGSAFSSGISMLLLFRFLTGIGIGGMMPSISAMVAEYSNEKRRDLAITIMGAGYPAGAILGGYISTILLVSYDWRSIFIFGALTTALAIPLVFRFLPESIHFLSHSKRPDALTRINRTLKKMGYASISSLAEFSADKLSHGTGFRRLFSGDLFWGTVLLTAAYFLHIGTFYYVLKWIPKIIVDLGYSPSAAGSVLVWANVGGIIGSVGLGLLSQRFDLSKLVIGGLVLASFTVVIFGYQQHSSLAMLSLVSACAVFFITSAIVGLFALFARHFPAEIRASGIGLAAGVGRGGAALGPIIAGLLFSLGGSLLVVSISMAAGSALAACAVVALSRRTVISPNPGDH